MYLIEYFIDCDYYSKYISYNDLVCLLLDYFNVDFMFNVIINKKHKYFNSKKIVILNIYSFDKHKNVYNYFKGSDF